LPIAAARYHAHRMRILEVSVSGTIGTAHMGPVSNDICELSNHFASRGHAVTVADLSAESARQFLHKAIQVIELSGTPESRVQLNTRHPAAVALRSWQNYSQYVSQLISRVDISKADVVHVHTPVPAFLLQRLHRIPTFYTAHTPL